MADMFQYFADITKYGKAYLDNKLSGYGINSGQYYYIIIICDNEGITQDKIKSIVHVHPSNVTRALDILDNNGYVIKKDLESDGRTCKLYPTQKAKDIYSKILKLSNEWVSIITNNFSDNEKELFEKLLKKAVSATNEYVSIK